MIVYVVVLSGMIKVTSLLTGLVLVGAGTALLFGDSSTKNSDDGETDKMNGKYKAKGESLGMFIFASVLRTRDGSHASSWYNI